MPFFYFVVLLLLLYLAILIFGSIMSVLAGVFFDYGLLIALSIVVTGPISYILGAGHFGFIHILFIVICLYFLFSRYSRWRKNNQGNLSYRLITLYSSIFGVFSITNLFLHFPNSHSINFPYLGGLVLELIGPRVVFLSFSKIGPINIIFNLLFLSIAIFGLYRFRNFLDNKALDTFHGIIHRNYKD